MVWFYHDINPVLLSIGPLEIRYYGLVYALGFIAAYFLLRYAAKKAWIKNFNPEKADIFIFYLIIGAIIGARLLLFVFYHPATLLSNPLEVFMIWHGGMSFHGGLVGAIAAGLLFCKKHKVSFYELGDLMVIPAAFFLFLGRLANFVNGELVGTRTNLPWCVVFEGYEGCRHPSQLYEAGKNLLMFLVLGFLYFKKQLKKGVVFWGFFVMYGVLRFMVTFYRADPDFIIGLSRGQVMSLVMAVIGITALIIIHLKKPKNIKSPETSRDKHE